MRTILRVGITVGGVAFVTLFALQSAISLAVAAGIVLTGLCAGLGTAKWLERSWYGRQLAAGLRSGTIAVGMAGVGALLALLTQGTRSPGQLAERSHLFRFDLGPAIETVSGAGWVGVDLLVISLATIAGIALCMCVTQIGAWTKSRRAIQIVTQARLAAQGPFYDDRAGVSGLFGVVGVPASIPPHSRLAGPQPARADFASAFGDQSLIPPTTSARVQPIEPIPKGGTQRQPSKARPAESQLTEAMREALATWAGDNSAANEADPGSGSAESTRGRTPAPSNYLNSTPPAPAKRVRKKQNTDWLR
jgi:hypothetical protein